MEFSNNKIYIKTLTEPTKYLRSNTFFSNLFSILNINFDFIDLNTTSSLWEEFEIIPVGDNNKFVFRAYNNKYISGNPNGNITLSSNYQSLNSWEVFEIIRNDDYYLIKSIAHNRYLKTYSEDFRVELMDNQEMNICNYFNFEIVNPIIDNILFNENEINNLNNKLIHYENVKERGKPTSRKIKGLIIDLMKKIIEFNNHYRFINTDELFSFSQKIDDILIYNNNKSLDNIYKNTIGIDKDKLYLLTNAEINNISTKILKYSRKYIVILQDLFETYEQDFEEPSLRKRVTDLITIIISLLSLIIAIISLCIQFR